MTRSTLVRLLEILVRARQITPQQAGQTLAAYDAGELSADALPLSIADTDNVTEDDHIAAVLAVAALLGIYGARLRAGQPGIPLSARAKVRDLLRTAFERLTARLATALTASGNVRQWHGDMAAVVRDYILQQAIVGAARPLQAAELAAVRQTMREQADYLLRFAGRVAVGLAIGAALTTRAVWSRATLYAGAGWEWFWRGNESGVRGEEGIVVYWDAVDDNRTCDRCREASRNSPYLPGESHPWPGSGVCQGLGRCRCRLRYEYNLDAWRRLTGRRIAA